MELKIIISIIGLTLDSIGAVFIFFFGIPPNLDRKGTILLALEGEDREEKNKARKYDFLSHTGLMLFFLGFILQIFSNFARGNVGVDKLKTFFLLLSVGVLVVFSIAWIIFIVWRIFLKMQVTFRGQYCSIIEKGNNGQTHFWKFKIRNEGEGRINFEFCLPGNVEYWEVVQSKRDIQKCENKQKIDIKELDPNDYLEVRVWNMGTGGGKNTYLCFNGKKIIYPKIYPFLD